MALLQFNQTVDEVSRTWDADVLESADVKLNTTVLLRIVTI